MHLLFLIRTLLLLLHQTYVWLQGFGHHRQVRHAKNLFHCNHCKGSFSTSCPEISSGPRCYSVLHIFATCMSNAYVDDTILPAESEQTLLNLVEYATELLDLFSYSFKDIDINYQPLPTSKTTLDVGINSGQSLIVSQSN